MQPELITPITQPKLAPMGAQIGWLALFIIYKYPLYVLMFLIEIQSSVSPTLYFVTINRLIPKKFAAKIS